MLGTGPVRYSIAVVVCRVVAVCRVAVACRVVVACRVAIVCRVVIAAQCQNSPHSRILFLRCTEQEEVAVIRGIRSRGRTRRAS
jgi:hypothetical protein